MPFKMKSPLPLAEEKKEEEIKDNIISIPDLSEKAYDVDIIKQHIINRPKRRFKKPKNNNQQNTDRLV